MKINELVREQKVKHVVSLIKNNKTSTKCIYVPLKNSFVRHNLCILNTHLQIIIMSVYIQQINYSRSTLNVFSMHEHLTNDMSENLVNSEHVLIMP